MFTRCPECQPVFDLRATQLAQASGRTECGHCEHVFNAIENLFNEWPEEQQGLNDNPESGTPPKLGQQLPADDDWYELGSQNDAEVNSRSKHLYQLWYAVLALLVIITLTNLSWTYREALLENPKIRSLAKKSGLVPALQDNIIKDSSRIFLVSRDLHPHPTAPEALILSATLINRAEFRQPYPVLQITLYDLQQHALAQRYFEPAEYLSTEANFDNGLSPNILLPIVLEMEDPGPQAVGFEIQFL